MDKVAAGFWGAFFCTAALMLLLSLAAFARSHRRVALLAGLTSAVSAGFVIVFLGWLPFDGAAEARTQAHVAVVAAVSLALMLMLTLGVFRRRAGRTALLAVVGAGVLCIAASWTLDAGGALALGCMFALALSTVMLVLAARSALRGERGGRGAAAALSLVIVSVAGLSWIAFEHPVAWPVHAITALAAVSYLCVTATALWARYSYLLELAEVMAHGPAYDPVTRMRSHTETGQMVGDVFFRREGVNRPVGVIAVCIANLYALENLHGRAAFNHALFVCAGRLRRSVPQYVEMGRLGEDGFLLLVRNVEEPQRLAQLARTVRERLSRPIALSIGSHPAQLEAGGTAWVAEVGVGVLATTTQVRPSQAVATARAMARTAWSYASRLAFFDQAAGQIAELPPEEEPRELARAA